MFVDERVARALRMRPRSADALSALIDDYEGEALRELEGLGVPIHEDEAPSESVLDAITCYVVSRMAEGKDAERMEQRWETMSDNLRKRNRGG